MGQTAASASWIRQTEPTACDAVQQRLCCSAVRQLATVQAYAAAVVHAPSLDERLCAVERAREELERLEQLVELFRERFASELLTLVADEAAGLATPGSWLEACAAQLALSLAARIDLCAPEAPRSPLTRAALAEETEHLAAARAALEDIADMEQFCAEEALGCLQRWREVALATLPAEAARQTYLRELESELHSAGLSASTSRAANQSH
jgi:hypothetical protein